MRLPDYKATRGGMRGLGEVSLQFSHFLKAFLQGALSAQLMFQMRMWRIMGHFTCPLEDWSTIRSFGSP